MRPRPAGLSSRDPHSPGARARLPPLAPDLPCSGGSQRPAGRCPVGPARCPARQGPRGPLGTGAFFWPPRYSLAASGLLARPSRAGPHSLALAAGGGRLGLALSLSHPQPAGAGRAPATCPGREERGRQSRAAAPPCQHLSRPADCRGGLPAVQKYGDLLTAAP